MATHSVTVELSDDIYQRAEEIAQATQRSVEQVVVEWIHPPVGEQLTQEITNLEELSNEQLVEIAKSSLPETQVQRLQELLAIQQQRTLTEQEQREATSLVEQEDLLTLQKARALYLLKQRGASLENVAPLLG